MELELQIPQYLNTELNKNKLQKFTTDESKMNLVHKITHHNIASHTGGPFGAALFIKDRLLSLGVNLVINQEITCLHAEIVAILLANKLIHSHDLSSCGEVDLYTSSFPCGMCLGAVIWSGIKRIIYSTASTTVEKYTGFDEGVKVVNLKQQLLERGIIVNGPILEDQGVELLKLYMRNKGPVYNSANNRLLK